MEQMAYKGRLAKLLLQSENVLDRYKHKRTHTQAQAVTPPVTTAATTTESIDTMLEEVEDVVQLTRSSGGAQHQQQERVQDMIQQTLKKKKKHSRAGDTSQPLPLDPFDWRARAI